MVDALRMASGRYALCCGWSPLRSPCPAPRRLAGDCLGPPFCGGATGVRRPAVRPRESPGGGRGPARGDARGYLRRPSGADGAGLSRPGGPGRVHLLGAGGRRSGPSTGARRGSARRHHRPDALLAGGPDVRRRPRAVAGHDRRLGRDRAARRAGRPDEPVGRPQHGRCAPVRPDRGHAVPRRSPDGAGLRRARGVAPRPRVRASSPSGWSCDSRLGRLGPRSSGRSGCGRLRPSLRPSRRPGDPVSKPGRDPRGRGGRAS